MRLGLSTDGFAPFAHYGQSYSCWPVIVTPYNLPPWMCMRRQFMFLSLLIPGPRNPKGNLDIYMQPLIEELINLWQVGIMTFDIARIICEFVHCLRIEFPLRCQLFVELPERDLFHCAK